MIRKDGDYSSRYNENCYYYVKNVKQRVIL